MHQNFSARAAALLVPVAASVAAGQAVVFWDDFSGTPSDAFSSGVTLTQSGVGTVLGPFGLPRFGGDHRSDALTFDAPTLGGGTYALSYDLLVIGSWNGNDGSGVSRDSFTIAAGDEALFETTFDYRPSRAAYVDPDAEGRLADFGNLTFLRYNDLSLVFTSEEDITRLTFAVDTTGRDEGFAIDNVRLTSLNPPVPAPASAGVLAVCGAWLTRRRRS